MQKRIILKWEKNRLIQYYDIFSSKFIEASDAEGRIIDANERTNYFTDYIVHDDSIEVVLYSLDTSIPSETETRLPKKFSTIWIYPNASVKYFNEYEDREEIGYVDNMCELPFPFSDYPTLFDNEDEIIQQMLGIIPIKLINGKKVKKIRTIQDVAEFVCRSLDEKLALDLPQGEIIQPAWEDETCETATMSKIGDYCCMTVFTQEKANGKTSEFFRLYASKTEFVACQLIKGKLYEIPFTDIISKFTINDYNQEAVSGTKFAYFTDIVNAMNKKTRGRAVYTFFKEPLFETFCKQGYTKIVEYILKQNKYSYEIALSHFLGFSYPIDMDRKKKKFNAITMMNQTQLEKLCTNFENTPDDEKRFLIESNSEMILLRNFFGRQISSLDDNTFDKYLNLAKQASKSNIDESKAMRFASAMSLVVSIYDDNAKQAIIERVMEFEKDEFNEFMEKGLFEYLQYLNIVKEFSDEDRSGYKATFSSVDNINVMLDNALYLDKFKKDREKTEQFREGEALVSKFKYSNDNYSVLVPRTPEDLVYEGNQLNHCVGGYVDRVINKKTFILFIREKSNLSKPFFTVEIEENGDIEQIHGQSNCSSSTVNGLPEFIREWCRAVGARKHNIDKVR